MVNILKLLFLGLFGYTFYSIGVLKSYNNQLYLISISDPDETKFFKFTPDGNFAETNFYEDATYFNISEAVKLLSVLKSSSNKNYQILSINTFLAE